MGKLLKSFVVLVAVCFAATAALADKRVALVIGNSDYANATSLRNPENDASAISNKLKGLGFDVIEGTNLDYDALRDTVRQFAGEARDADLTIFYYAGHGIAVDGVNYMVPVDAHMNDPVDWEFEVFALDEVLRLVGRSKGPSLVFLDACRDNPMAESLAMAQGMATRSMNTRGLSRIPTNTIGTSGSVIGYATEPGQVASDGEGENSPFTKALLEHIGASNTDFATLTSLITRDVMEFTGSEQRPRFDISLTGPLILNKVETPVVQTPVPETTQNETPAPSTSIEIEKVLFETARESGDVADYQAYLDMFPNGSFAVVARNALNRAAKEEEEAAVEVAKLDTGTDQVFADTRVLNAPLVLRATPAVLVKSANQEDERSLALSKLQRQHIQLRLNVSGNNVGALDGSIGPGTRRGISSWQQQNGLSTTGYLNALQLQILTANTESQFVDYVANNPNAFVQGTSGGGSKRKKQNNNNSLGAFLGGVAAGIIISK
ncbi:MAG: caspase family protein [Roseobacter sp.]